MAFSCFFHVMSHPLIDTKPLPDTPKTAKTGIEAAFSPLEAAFFGIEAFHHFVAIIHKRCHNILSSCHKCLTRASQQP